MRINNGTTDPTDPPTVATDPPRNQPADDQSIIDLCDAYLATLHASSWGRTFYIHSAETRHDAAYWLASQIEGVMNHVRASKGSE